MWYVILGPPFFLGASWTFVNPIITRGGPLFFCPMIAILLFHFTELCECYYGLSMRSTTVLRGPFLPQFSRGFASLYNGSLLVGPLLLSKHFTIYKDVNFKNKEDQGRELEFCNWPCLELMMRVYLENAIHWCS